MQERGCTLTTNGCETRGMKYISSIVEQNHRFIKRSVKPDPGFFPLKLLGTRYKDLRV